MTTQRPVHEVRLGRICAAVWQNSTDSGVRYNVTLSRLFKRSPDSDWERTDSLGRDDLLVAAKVLDRAHTWILENAQTSAQATA